MYIYIFSVMTNVVLSIMELIICEKVLLLLAVNILTLGVRNKCLLAAESLHSLIDDLDDTVSASDDLAVTILEKYCNDRTFLSTRRFCGFVKNYLQSNMTKVPIYFLLSFLTPTRYHIWIVSYWKDSSKDL